MSGQQINLCMWGYQQSFRVHVESSMNAVCVEPEEGKWPISLFDGLLGAIEAEFASHPERDTFYGDRPRMEEKPEKLVKRHWVKD